MPYGAGRFHVSGSEGTRLVRLQVIHPLPIQSIKYKYFVQNIYDQSHDLVSEETNN